MMNPRFVAAAFGALILSVDAISTRPHYWNGTSTTTVCGDNCWSTSTVYAEAATVTKWSTTTLWGEAVSTITEVLTKPASTVTVTVTEKGSGGHHPSSGEPSASSYSQSPALSSQPASVVTAYITTSIIVVGAQTTTETDWLP